jgi:xanthine dehydrogenase accessory factor
MSDALFDELVAARQSRTSCALVTVATTSGSVPRAAGSKMLVYGAGRTSGTIGGGKFEALVVEDALATLRQKKPTLKTYSLRDGETDSFGAICGGDVTVFIEPQMVSEALYLIGAGHCAHAIARLARDCGLFVTVVDDRAELLADLPPVVVRISDVSPSEFIAAHQWQSDEALIIVSRNHEIDLEALGAAVQQTGAGYIGMIGSRRKVARVFDQLKERGVSDDQLAQVYAPLGLDIGADSPTEIAVSTIAEILAVLRQRTAKHLRGDHR